MGGGGALTPTTTSTPSSPSSSSEPLPPEFAEYVAVSSVSDDEESDQCRVCDDDEEVDVIPCSNRQLREWNEEIDRLLRERNEETDRLLRERNEETDRLPRERNKESDRLFFSKKSDRLLHGWDDIDHLLGERKEESDRLQREKDDKFERLWLEGDEKFARLRREDNEEYDPLLREGDAGKEKFDSLRHEGNEKFNRLQREQSEKFYRLLYEENEEFDSLLREGNEESDSQLLEAKEESDQGCAWDRYFNRQLTEAKELIRRYKPGDWVEGVGGAKAGHFVLPEITTLLLVGPRGSGKSTLVNRITRVFDKDNDPSAPDRAQVSRNSRSNGTVFLREYPIPRNSSAICIYDTRGWSNDPEKNFKMLHQWMTKGIRNGDATMWDNDEGNKTVDIKPLGRQYSFLRYITRKVNFLIFVVDGVAVLESIDSNNKGYTEILHQTFMYPFLSIGDDKPVVVVTHGDRLSMQQRAHVQSELAELLNIPAQQIYDIPGSDDYQTDMAVLDMLHYCVRHAERNLPVKLTYHLEVFGRETLNKMAEQLMGLDAVIEVAIIFLCIVILLLRFFR